MPSNEAGALTLLTFPDPARRVPNNRGGGTEKNGVTMCEFPIPHTRVALGGWNTKQPEVCPVSYSPKLRLFHGATHHASYSKDPS